MIKIQCHNRQNEIIVLPFENLSNLSLDLEVGTLSIEDFRNRPYDVSVQLFSACKSKSRFYLKVFLRRNKYFTGKLPLRDFIRKVLVLKVKNSSVCYSYPLELEIYDKER